jgi:hypothetical protein
MKLAAAALLAILPLAASAQGYYDSPDFSAFHAYDDIRANQDREQLYRQQDEIRHLQWEQEHEAAMRRYDEMNRRW